MSSWNIMLTRMALKTRKRCGPTVDKLSLLPDTIIENILMFLPLQEAVRTSALSRRWRYVWTKLPRLVFDDSFCNSDIRNDEIELMMTIYQVLMLHRGAVIKFTLSLSGLGSCSYIDCLILFLSNNGIKDIRLDIRLGEQYMLPSSLFSCVQLEHLNLSSCIFRPPHVFKGFTALVSLKFRGVRITGDVCSKLISRCPLLERLTLDTLVDCNHIDIVAPRLKFFYYWGVFVSISFKNTPHLETLTMYLNEVLRDDGGAESEEKIAMPFNRLHSLRCLKLDYRFIKPKRIAKDMIHLKTLKLYNIFFGKIDAALTALSLIRRSPNLEKLTIKAQTFSLVPERAVAVVDTEDFSLLSLKRLREVEMKNISGMQLELVVIMFILATSPRLQRMIIKPNLRFVKDNGLSILKEVTQYRRASPLARITFISS